MARDAGRDAASAAAALNLARRFGSLGQINTARAAALGCQHDAIHAAWHESRGRYYEAAIRWQDAARAADRAWAAAGYSGYAIANIIGAAAHDPVGS